MADIASDDRIHHLAHATKRLSVDSADRMDSRFITESLDRVVRIAEEGAAVDPRLDQARKDLDQVRLGWDREELASDDVAKDLDAIVKDMRGLYATKLTYEGPVDLSDRDEHIRAGFFLPGDEVRADPTRRIAGVDTDAILERIGTEPLTVTDTVVRGDRHESGVGGSSHDTMEVRYRFDGLPDLYPAGMFQEANGEKAVYAALVLQNDRLWAVPMDADETRVEGRPREVVGIAGRNLEGMHPRGLEGFKEQVAEDIQIGPMSLATETPGAESGPVRILSAPWHSGLDSHAQGIVLRALADEIADQAQERRQALFAEMEAASVAYRAGMPGQSNAEGHAVSSLEVANTAAWGEARHLLVGREDDPIARMVAAQVATDRRDITDGGEISATRLEDALAAVPSGRPSYVEIGERDKPGSDAVRAFFSKGEQRPGHIPTETGPDGSHWGTAALVAKGDDLYLAPLAKDGLPGGVLKITGVSRPLGQELGMGARETLLRISTQGPEKVDFRHDARVGGSREVSVSGVSVRTDITAAEAMRASSLVDKAVRAETTLNMTRGVMAQAAGRTLQGADQASAKGPKAIDHGDVAAALGRRGNER